MTFVNLIRQPRNSAREILKRQHQTEIFDMLLASSFRVFGVLRRSVSGIVIKESDLFEKFVLGGGPGGQSVNKSRNRVQLTHLPTGIQVCCQDER